MKVGSFVFATDQGLGVLAKSFYDAGIVNHVVVVQHTSRFNHTDWYPGALTLSSAKLNSPVVKRFVRDMDVMLFFETPFVWDYIGYCRGVGTRSVLMPMYECMPERLPVEPDLFLCPSLLDKDYYPQHSRYVPVPVEGVEWRERTRAEVFVHNAGNMGLRNRNGTLELLRAMNYVKSPIQLIIRQQTGELLKSDDPRVQIRRGSVPRAALWSEGDVFVFPDKFNGLSLPLQEAKAAGMLVMATNRYPANTYLNPDPLIPVHHYVQARVANRFQSVEEAIIDPRALAKTIDHWYGQDITEYSREGRQYNERMSWKSLKPLYEEVLRTC